MTNKESKAIQKYLNKVKKYLGGRTASEQSELIRQLEEHIHESIRQSPNTPVADIIADMDPPESFGETGDRDLTAPAVLGRLTLGQLSLIVLIIGVITPFILMAISVLIRGNVGSIINVGLPLGILLVIVALAMGIAARREKTGRATIIASVALLLLLTILVPVSRTVNRTPEPTIQHLEVGVPDDFDPSTSE
jgi:hypothetical protein